MFNYCFLLGRQYLHFISREDVLHNSFQGEPITYDTAKFINEWWLAFVTKCQTILMPTNVFTLNVLTDEEKITGRMY